MTINRKIKLPEKLDDLKIDLGCGDKEHDARIHGREGYIGIDIKDYGQDIVWNIEEGIPLSDNSVKEIFCWHVLEHIKDIAVVMDEMWRILKPDGILELEVPEKNCDKAYIFQHVRRFTKETIQLLGDKNYIKEYLMKPWKILEINLNEKKFLNCKLQPNKDEKT